MLGVNKYEASQCNTSYECGEGMKVKVVLQLPTLPSPLRSGSCQATLVLLLIIGAGAALATEDQQQRLDLEQEQLLTRLPWLLLHPPLLR